MDNLIETKTETVEKAPVDESNIILSDLPKAAQAKLEVIQSLLEPCDRNTYGERLRAGAQKLKISVRSVQRLFKKYQEEGLGAIVSGDRADKGQHRISQFWQEFIIKTYKQGNQGSKRMTPKQVALKVEVKAQEIGEKPPTYRTVLRVLKPLIEKKQKTKSIRSAGWQGSNHAIKTRDGDELEITHSNQVWQCDHTKVDLLLVDQYGELIGRPWLTTVVDSYSRCVMGIRLGFDAPSSQVVALALRHAILPKNYESAYKLQCDWDTFGCPAYFYTDGGKDFRSQHMTEIATQLGFTLKLRQRPSEGGIIERPYRTLNQSLLSQLPGYTGSNVQERPKQAEKDAQLTLQELERLVVRFIVDQYNPSIDARTGNQTRFQRWEAGLLKPPEMLSPRELDICLMKQARRTVQRQGHIQFENIIYRGEYLAGYAGEVVSLRYDPRDITTVWIYHQENQKEEFLTRAHALDLETETLSLEEAKAMTCKIRQAGQSISNESILQATRDRDAFIEDKKTRKQRQQQEQHYQNSQPLSVVEKAEAHSEEIETDLLPSDLNLEQIEVWDLEQMREDYGW